LHRERYAVKQQGGTVEPLDRRAELKKREERESEGLRLSVLLEVQQQWIHSKNSTHFTNWLKAEVERVGGKKVA